MNTIPQSGENDALLKRPLFRLLAINLLAGVAIALLLVGGLLLLDPGGLRHLIFADQSPGVGLGLLAFGLIVTFGSATMGTAIMAIGRDDDDKGDRSGGHRKPLHAPAHAMENNDAPRQQRRAGRSG